MAEFQLPKDCYGLFSGLEEKLKKGHVQFEDVIPQLLQPGYWVEVDWKSSSKGHRKDIKATPMLLVSFKKQEIVKNFSDKTITEVSKLVREGYSIFLSARIVNNWGYKTKK